MKKIPLLMSFCLTFLALTYSAFSNESDSLDLLKKRLSNRAVAAHQGGLFGAWPNTLLAFEQAYEAGVDIIEMDLHTTKDGVVVVYHDLDLKTWTKCKGSIHDKTLAEVQACRFTFSSKARIATFEEVLAWSSGKVVIDAEFKDVESIKPAIQLVKNFDAYSWTYFQAQGSREKFFMAHEIDPDIALLYSIHNTGEDLEWALGQSDSLMIVELNKETRSAEVIDRIHQNGKLVTEDSWHFSKSSEILTSAHSCKKAFAANIDIPVTNRPRACVRQK